MSQVQKAVDGPGRSGARSRLRVRVRADHLPRHLPKLSVPVIGWRVPLPSRDQLPWVAGVALCAALDLVEWPVAAVVIAGHTLAAHSRNESLRRLAEGIESAA
jgi:hypothetical protein